MSAHLLLIVTGVVVVILAVPSASTGGMTGGIEPAKVDDGGVILAANFATAEMDKKSNSMFANKMTKIISAKTQVVAGVKYYLTIELTQSGCKNDSECKVSKPEKQICEVVVWEQSWLNKIDLLKDSCKMVK